jgi:protein TonB
MALLVAPTPPPAPPAPQPMRSARETTSNLSREGQVIAPRSVPREILHVEETSAPPPVDVGGISVVGGTGNSLARNTLLDSIGRGLNAIVPPPSPTLSAHAPRVSRMMEGNLIYRVQPQYSPLARQARVQGIVVLRAMISREGKIENVQVISGHPLLVKSAMRFGNGAIVRTT